MIAIASSSDSERNALGALIEASGWAAIECHSVRAAIRSLQRHQPRVVVARYRLDDGYSDDIVAALAALEQLAATKLIVLLDAGVPSAIEVRQLHLGADCVLRNPIRTDVLIAYIRKYLRSSPRSSLRRGKPGLTTVAFCGGTFEPIERLLVLGPRQISLTPREGVLIEMLTQYPGTVVSYERLYGDILGRKFQGDTSNMRVLLGKLVASCQSIGMSIRLHVHVIPKTGYRYATRAGAASYSAVNR